jgi:hypothetical protein
VGFVKPPATTASVNPEVTADLCLSHKEAQKTQVGSADFLSFCASLWLKFTEPFERDGEQYV